MSRRTYNDVMSGGGVLVTGEWAPGTTAGGTAGPDVPCRIIRLKARVANTGNVYLGVVGATVVAANGATDTACGFELDASEDTGWIPCDNLNQFKGLGDNATDSVTYMALT